MCREGQHLGDRSWLAEIEHHILPPAIERGHDRARRGASLGDPHHLASQIREQHRGERHGADRIDLDDPHPGKRSFGRHISLPALPRDIPHWPTPHVSASGEA